MKIAVRVTEMYTRTVIVDADNYDAAEAIVADAHEKGRLVMDIENSSVEIECKDDTAEYIKIFGKSFFEMDAEDLE